MLLTYIYFRSSYTRTIYNFIFEPRTQKKFRLPALFALYLFLFLLSFMGNFWVNTAAFFVCNFVYIYFIYEIKYMLAFFHSSVTTVVMSMCELFVSGILSHFFPHFLANTALFQNVILLAVFSKILYFFVLYLLAHIVIQRKKYNQYYDRTTFLLGLVPISSCIVTLTIVKLCERNTSSLYLDYRVMISALLLLATNLLVLGIHQFNQKKSMEFTELQLLLQKEEDTANYYEMLFNK